MENCPQCKEVVVCAESRLVQDSCGHVKCRLCLLSDSAQCLMCRQGNNGTETSQKQVDNPGKFSIPQHIRVIPGDPVMYKCMNCKRQFKVKYNCKYHEHCSLDNAKHLSCYICDQKFASNSHLNYHKLSHENLNPFKCLTCDKGFKNKGKLNRHMKIHSDSKKSWLCKVCNKSLLSIESLRRHMKIHTGLKEFQCDVCDKGFIEKHDLLKHKVTHSEEKKFVCELCKALFKRKYDLTLHLKAHQPLRKYPCRLCDKVFYSYHNMKRHRKQLHQNRKTFTCNDCKKCFTRKDNLERHVKSVHMEEEIDGSSIKRLLAIEPATEPSYQESVQNNSIAFNNRVSVIQKAPPVGK